MFRGSKKAAECNANEPLTPSGRLLASKPSRVRLMSAGAVVGAASAAIGLGFVAETAPTVALTNLNGQDQWPATAMAMVDIRSRSLFLARNQLERQHIGIFASAACLVIRRSLRDFVESFLAIQRQGVGIGRSH